jgi:hypothetical protein
MRGINLKTFVITTKRKVTRQNNVQNKKDEKANKPKKN